MPIQLVQDEERKVYKMGGSKIFYRRISTLKRGAIVKRHTKRGKPDWNAVAEDILRYVVLDWETVQVEGRDTPFDPDLLARLPEDNLSELMVLSGGACEDEDGPKN
jgi:hypothetical protein